MLCLFSELEVNKKVYMILLYNTHTHTNIWILFELSDDRSLYTLKPI